MVSSQPKTAQKVDARSSVPPGEHVAIVETLATRSAVKG
jgi:hypothetical protein